MDKSVIIALDFSNENEALNFLDLFKNEKLFVKVGMELFYQCGYSIIKEIKNRNHKIFLDLKLHDIPNTVYKAISGLAKFDIDFITIHAAGGSVMLNHAKQAITDSKKATRLVAITQLTSTSEFMMQKEQNIQSTLEESVLNYANLAKRNGIDGVVSSVWETQKIKKNCGEDFIVINPGIRMIDDKVDDQKRIASPLEAKNSGANFIVVGRSITKHENPVSRYYEIKEIFCK